MDIDYNGSGGDLGGAEDLVLSLFYEDSNPKDLVLFLLLFLLLFLFINGPNVEVAKEE